jgi:hypothetical protein
VIHARTRHPYLIEAAHLSVHCFPLSATGKCGRRRRCNSVEYRLDLGDDLVGQRIEEYSDWTGLERIVILVSSEEVDQPGLTGSLAHLIDRVGLCAEFVDVEELSLDGKIAFLAERVELMEWSLQLAAPGSVELLEFPSD